MPSQSAENFYRTTSNQHRTPLPIFLPARVRLRGCTPKAWTLSNMSECIIIGVDNSEFALNEDYSPSRWEAQRDIVNLLASVKTDGNPETTVGILSLAGKAPTIVVTPTQVPLHALLTSNTAVAPWSADLKRCTCKDLRLAYNWSSIPLLRGFRASIGMPYE